LSSQNEIDHSPAITTTPVTTTRRNIETNVRVHQITSATTRPGSPAIFATGGQSTTSSVTIKNLARTALDPDRIAITRRSMGNGRVVLMTESQQIPSRLQLPPSQSHTSKSLSREASLVLSDVSTDDENQNNGHSPRDDDEEDPRGEPQNAIVSLDEEDHQGQRQRNAEEELDQEFHGAEAQRVYSRELTRENFHFFSQQEEAEEDPEQLHMHSPVLSQPPRYPNNRSITTSKVDHLLQLVTSALATRNALSFLPSATSSNIDRQEYVTLPASHLRQIQQYLEILKSQQPSY
jgi:hypothetical protein